ncbi:Uncharacterised protein [Burkholderia cepacia]|nr:Uncharacterised protein [Burkholderia cepacia]
MLLHVDGNVRAPVERQAAGIDAGGCEPFGQRLLVAVVADRAERHACGRVRMQHARPDLDHVRAQLVQAVEAGVRRIAVVQRRQHVDGRAVRRRHERRDRGQPHDLLDELVVECAVRRDEAVRQVVVHRGEAGRGRIADPRRLNRRGALRQRNEPVAAGMARQVDHDVDAVVAHAFEEGRVAHAGDVAPGRGVGLEALGRVIFLEVIVIEVHRNAGVGREMLDHGHRVGGDCVAVQVARHEADLQLARRIARVREHGRALALLIVVALAELAVLRHERLRIEFAAVRDTEQHAAMGDAVGRVDFDRALQPAYRFLRCAQFEQHEAERAARRGRAGREFDRTPAGRERFIRAAQREQHETSDPHGLRVIGLKLVQAHALLVGFRETVHRPQRIGQQDAHEDFVRQQFDRAQAGLDHLREAAFPVKRGGQRAPACAVFRIVGDQFSCKRGGFRVPVLVEQRCVLLQQRLIGAAGRLAGVAPPGRGFQDDRRVDAAWGGRDRCSCEHDVG